MWVVARVRGSVDNLSVNYWFALHDEKKDQALVVGWLTGGGAGGGGAEEGRRGVTSTYYFLQFPN